MSGVLLLCLTGCGSRVERASESAPLAQLTSPSDGQQNVDSSKNEIEIGSGRAGVVDGGHGPANRTANTVASAARNETPGSPVTQPARSPADRTRSSATPASPAAGSPSSGGPTASLPAPNESVRRSPIVIGSVGTLSGPVGNALLPVLRGLQTWVRDANSRGGVNGHLIDLHAADDGGDPARHKALVRELVERRNVLALVGDPAVVTGSASFDYLVSKHIPVIGSDGGADYFYNSPTYFPQMAHGFSTYQLFQEAGMDGLAPGTPVGAFSCVEIQACEDFANLFPKVARSRGLNAVYTARASLAQPDFTAECLNLSRSQARVVVVAADGQTVQRLASSCARQNYRPTITINMTSSAPEQLKDPNLDGMLVGSNLVPWVLNSSPSLQAFHRAMAEYNPSLTPSGSTLQGWAAGTLFGAGAENLPEPPTSQALLDGMWHIKDNDLGGLTYPLSFSPDHPAARTVCYWRLRIAAGSFTAPDGLDRRCTEPILL